MAGKTNALRRIPLVNKGLKNGVFGEKNRLSGAPSQNGDAEEENTDRNLFFNLPLPPDYLDEEGAPKQTFPRNKIRTAKYTPLSFVPKNLFVQFHNIANIFFLFVVILVVSSPGYPMPLREDEASPQSP